MTIYLDSCDLESKFNPNEGVGVEFNASFDGVSGKQCITVPRSEEQLKVYASVTTYRGCINAIHFYGSLTVDGLHCYELADPKKQLFSTNVMPIETQGCRIDVYIPAKKDVFSLYEDEYRVTVSKGYPTHQFETIEECIEAIEIEFNRLFEQPWILSADSAETWEDQKVELIKQYSENI